MAAQTDIRLVDYVLESILNRDSAKINSDLAAVNKDMADTGLTFEDWTNALNKYYTPDEYRELDFGIVSIVAVASYIEPGEYFINDIMDYLQGIIRERIHKEIKDVLDSSRHLMLNKQVDWLVIRMIEWTGRDISKEWDEE